MNNLNKFRKSTVAILTALLIISIAAPLFSFAVAATGASISLSVASGPNGTPVTITGTGFAASSALVSVTIDGIANYGWEGTTPSGTTTAAGTFSLSANIGQSPTDTPAGPLVAGYHTISITDSAGNTATALFEITQPTITVTPTGPSGTSVLISGSGFSTMAGVTITSAQWKYTVGTTTTTNTITPAAASSTTSNPAILSSDVVSTTGTYVGTVTLDSSAAVPTGDTTITVKDSQGNEATYTYSVPTASNGGAAIVLSSTSGTQGSVVTVTGSGFGPLSTVTIAGSTGMTIATVLPSTVTTTLAGTFAAVFTIPVATPAKAYTISATDGYNNVGTATYTVTPSTKVELGTYIAGPPVVWTSSGTNTAPATSFTGLAMKLTLAGFPAVSTGSTAVTVSFSSNLGAVTPTAVIAGTGATLTGYSGVNFGISSTSTTGDAEVYLVFGATTLPVGSYTVTVTVGGVAYTMPFYGITNGAYTAVKTYQPLATTTLSAPIGSTISFVYFGAAAAASTATLDSSVSLTTSAAATATTWPNAGAPITVTIPSTTVGQHTLSLSDGTNTMSVVITVTSGTSVALYPSTALPGTKVTIIGSGFKQTAASAVATFNSATMALDKVTTDIDNTGLLVDTFTVPSATAGQYPISIADGVTVPYSTATATLTVSGSPSITLSSTTGNLTGTTLSITGSGFLGSSDLVISWDGVAKTAQNVFATGLVSSTSGKAQSNPSGGISLLTTTALSTWALGTAAVVGTHTITISDGVNTASATFTVRPEITLSTDSGKAGSLISISGDGFTGTSTLAANKITVKFNGTAATWLDSTGTAITPQSSVVATATTGVIPTTTYYIQIPTNTPAGTYTITVSDSTTAANSASATYTVLPTAAVTLSPNSGPTGATITLSGEGFVPGGTITAKFNGVLVTVSGTTTVRSGVTDAGKIAVTSTSLGTTAPTITVPSTVLPGEYTVTVTDTFNTATATYTVVPTAISVSSNAVSPGGQITVSGTGFLAPLTVATLSGPTGDTALTAAPITGATVAANGAWSAIITVPNRAAGTYTLTVGDGTHVATTQLTVVPAVTLTSATNLKGALVTIAGTGFKAGATITASFGGVAVTLSGTTTVGATGTANDGLINTGTAPTFTVPLTAAAGNQTVVVSDGTNTATAYFVVAAPTLQIVGATSGPVGTAVQIIGSGYTASSQIFVQVAGSLVAINPTNTQGASFVAYVTIPSTVSAGDVVITAADTQNNAASVTFTVTSTTGGSALPDTTTMSNTAKTTTTSGTATTSFTAGSTVKAGFTLQTASGSRSVVVAVTFQQGAKVYNMASFQTTMTTTPSAVSFSNLIPAGATGTWTAQLQVFAADGVTALAVQTLTFTVA